MKDFVSDLISHAISVRYPNGDRKQADRLRLSEEWE